MKHIFYFEMKSKMIAELEELEESALRIGGTMSPAAKQNSQEEKKEK